ncbi:hypothetical protein G3N61_26895 [Burkholderia sp. Ac-20349]|nr:MULTISPECIES: hypothetical protein [Burkholderia]MBN3842944.1 hypothetical protein [Burkholderia sp. Ac-20349]
MATDDRRERGVRRRFARAFNGWDDWLIGRLSRRTDPACLAPSGSTCRASGACRKDSCAPLPFADANHRPPSVNGGDSRDCDGCHGTMIESAWMEGIMANLLVRDVDDIVQRLRERAAANGRRAEPEYRAILAAALGRKPLSHKGMF